MSRKKNDIMIRSSAVEYLTFTASAGDNGDEATTVTA